MTLSKARPAGFTNGTLLDASELNTIQNEYVKAIDGAGGGNYAPATELNIGGSGMHFTSISSVPGGGELEIGGYLNIENGGHARIESGGDLLVLSGANLHVQPGATQRIDGAATVYTGGSIVLNTGGALNVNANGTLTITENGYLVGRKDTALYYLGAGGTDPDADRDISISWEYVFIAGAISAPRTYTLGTSVDRDARVGDQIQFALGPSGGSTTNAITIAAIVGGGAILAMPAASGTAQLRRAAGYAVAVTLTCVSVVPGTPNYITWMPRWTWY